MDSVQAVINRGTPKELSWSIDDYISPELILNIQKLAKEKNINWQESPLYDLVLILLESKGLEYIEEGVYDEEPEFIDLITSEMDVYLLGDSKINTDKSKDIARLYLPILLVIAYDIQNTF